jgi:hypothetical protein
METQTGPSKLTSLPVATNEVAKSRLTRQQEGRYG